MKLLLASRLASEALRLSLFSPAHPSTPRLRRVRDTTGMPNESLIFLARQVAWMAVEKAKVRQAMKRLRVLPPGVVLLFSRFCQSILTAMCLTGRVATHLRKNEEPEWKRPRVKRYGRCARSPPLQRTSGAVTRLVLFTLWNFWLLLARAPSLWRVCCSRYFCYYVRNSH